MKSATLMQMIDFCIYTRIVYMDLYVCIACNLLLNPIKTYAYLNR